MYELSICAETVLQRLPFEERLPKIIAQGFFVEFWRWTGRDLDRIASLPGLRISGFHGIVRGSMVHPDGVPEFLDGIEKSLPAADKLGCRNLFLLTGHLGPAGEVIHQISEHPATIWITAYKTLCRVAEFAEKHNLTYCLEPLNTKVDHAGYPLPLAGDALRLVTAVGSPRIKILLDLYHTQIQEGNLIDVIRECGDHIGHIHVADVPGRHEPGTGEIDYKRVARILRDINYSGSVGLEAYPEGDDTTALDRFRRVFAWSQ